MRHPLVGILLVVVLAHVVSFTPTEPYFNNDETRHVMTGVYFRDLLLDRPAPGDLKAWTERYYVQHPALGLLVWPPAFYGIEGVVFLVLGDSFLVARLLVLAFALIACVYCFLLVENTHDRGIATVATLVLGLCPLVFQYSLRVMLEVPTLAWALMAIYHFHRYLNADRTRDLAVCCAATALTALTRFDGIFLAPCFGVWLLIVRKMKVVLRPSVLIGVASALLVVAPVYWLTARYFGASHVKAVKEGTGADSTGLFSPVNFVYYPLSIPRQIGWACLPLLALGLPTLRAVSSRPYIALLVGVYVTFTPMAELEERHAIYWIPALTVLVAVGCRRLSALVPRLSPVVPVVLFVGIGVQSWTMRGWFVFGYEEAAEYVAEHNEETPVCLFDGYLNGGFIYHLRRNDPDRRLWVLRGDKLFYGMLSDPHAAYEEYAKTEKDVLDRIHRYDPELIVLEEPEVHLDGPLAGATLLREVVKRHPDRFVLVKVVPIESNQLMYRGHQLRIYRNAVRNPNREEIVEFRVIGLDRDVGAPMK